MAFATPTYGFDVYGWINLNFAGPTYTAYDFSGITTGKPRTLNGSAGERRGYFSHDTSALPDNCVIHSGLWHGNIWNVLEDVSCADQVYKLQMYWEHDRIGAAITTDDWGFANQEDEHSFGSTPPARDDTFEISFDDPMDAFNRDGDTDIEIRNTSAYTSCTNGPEIMLNAMVGVGIYLCYLECEYSLQGVLSKTPTGRILDWGLWCLSNLTALSHLLMERDVLPPRSRVKRVEGDLIIVETKFVPRTVGVCS